jgi:hypothetical protein
MLRFGIAKISRMHPLGSLSGIFSEEETHGLSRRRGSGFIFDDGLPQSGQIGDASVQSQVSLP